MLSDGFGGAIGGGIVDDDELKKVGGGLLIDGAEAGEGDLAGVVGDEEDGERHTDNYTTVN
jgi:hypothetical protein